jgi:uncharacterized phage protein (TIGR02216 family)
MMAVGLGRLRLAPDAFWAMTPKEYAAAIGSLAPGRGAPPPGRGDLMALMAAYPDRIEEE